MTRLTNFCPPNRTDFVIRPWSFANAIRLPLKDTEPMKPPMGRHGEMNEVLLRAAIQLDGRNGRGCAAAHAVVERDHLRHVGHGDALAAHPGDDAADADGGEHQDEIELRGSHEKASVASVASSMPTPAQRTPLTAVTGELMRFSPRMNERSRDEIRQLRQSLYRERTA